MAKVELQDKTRQDISAYCLQQTICRYTLLVLLSKCLVCSFVGVSVCVGKPVSDCG